MCSFQVCFQFTTFIFDPITGGIKSNKFISIDVNLLQKWLIYHRLCFITLIYSSGILEQRPDIDIICLLTMTFAMSKLTQDPWSSDKMADWHAREPSSIRAWGNDFFLHTQIWLLSSVFFGYFFKNWYQNQKLCLKPAKHRFRSNPSGFLHMDISDSTIVESECLRQSSPVMPARCYVMIWGPSQ